VATGAESFGVSEFHGGIETTPENDTHDKTAQGKESQAEIFAGAGNRAPVA
jgi:hypothetical protein